MKIENSSGCLLFTTYCSLFTVILEERDREDGRSIITVGRRPGRIGTPV
jgi:hypothetical protein